MCTKEMVIFGAAAPEICIQAHLVPPRHVGMGNNDFPGLHTQLSVLYCHKSTSQIDSLYFQRFYPVRRPIFPPKPLLCVADTRSMLSWSCSCSIMAEVASSMPSNMVPPRRDILSEYGAVKLALDGQKNNGDSPSGRL